jgi:hypothetical protein
MAIKKPVRRKKSNVTTVDFSGVKSGGSIRDGRYKAKITGAEQEEGKESGEPYTSVTWEITSDKCNGREIRFDNYSHQPSALWRLKGLLEALGVEVPDGEHEIDWDEIISDETECIIELTGEKNSEGKTYARVTGMFPVDDGDTVDEDDDRPAGKPQKPAKDEAADDDDVPPTRRGKAAKDEPEGEDEDDEPKKAASKKIKKGAKVKFKDEKNKLQKGEIESIDGDTAVVVTADDDSYEIDIDELTVIG